MSKLDSKKYPMADPSAWLVFSNCNANVDPIFLGRLAALAQFMGKKITIISGLRTTQQQITAYKKSGGKLVNGAWTGGNGMAAKPGNSWHEYGFAIDTSSAWLKTLEKDAATDLQKTLIKFGVFKPLTKGNKTSVFEDWHIQPIETKGITDKKKFANS